LAVNYTAKNIIKNILVKIKPMGYEEQSSTLSGCHFSSRAEQFSAARLREQTIGGALHA
jgi:hypothetical protein